MKILKKLLKTFFIILILFSITILINQILNEQIFISRYQINSKEIPQKFDDYRIIQITDVHSIRKEEHKEKILNKLKKENPDIIFVTGDLVDSEYYSTENIKYQNKEIDFPDRLTLEFMEELVDISDVYFVYGNHEMILLDDPENNIFKKKLEDIGVKILNNKKDIITIDEQKIRLLGIQDPAALYKDKKYAYIDSNKEKVKTILDNLTYNQENEYTILLSHRPEYFELYNEYNINLAFTGHTHGGIIRLPIIGGLYAHPQGWFPKYDGGFFNKDNFNMIVGRGIGYSKVQIRIFNPPEIVLVTLNRI